MKKIYLYISLLFFPWYLWGQDMPMKPYKSMGEPLINVVPTLELGFPLGSFKDKIDENGLKGKGIAIFYRMKKAPIDVGLRWDGFSYDHVRRPYSGNVQKTKAKIWNLSPALRLEPETALPFQPYIESFFGFNHFFTKTYTYDVGDRIFNNDDDSRFDTDILESDWGWSLGSGIGAYFILEKEFYSAIDVQLGFRLSSKGTFLVKNLAGGVQAEPIDNYHREEAALAIISFKVGFSIFGYR
jgi:hypothetical protein